MLELCWRLLCFEQLPSEEPGNVLHQHQLHLWSRLDLQPDWRNAKLQRLRDRLLLQRLAVQRSKQEQRHLHWEQHHMHRVRWIVWDLLVRLNLQLQQRHLLMSKQPDLHVLQRGSLHVL